MYSEINPSVHNDQLILQQHLPVDIPHLCHSSDSNSWNNEQEEVPLKNKVQNYFMNIWEYFSN